MKLKKQRIDIHQIPSGSASEHFTHGCLVLEGGAFRGVYTSGVLDYFMENDLNFDCVIGVSAGALNGLNYVSGQIGRSARINLLCREDSRYVGVKAFFNSRSIIRLDYLFEEANEVEPLHRENFYKRKQRYTAVATNCLTGAPEYFEKGKCSDLLSAIKASATMPFIGPRAQVDAKPYLDGGCSCEIPYEWALDQGYEKIIVVQTRERGYRVEEKQEEIVDRVAHRIYREYPALIHALQQSSTRYNNMLEDIESLSDRGRIFAITPSTPVQVSRLEKDITKLKDLYDLGYSDAREQFKNLKRYLSV